MRISDLQGLGFPSKMTRSKLVNMLKLKYPHFDWDVLRFSKEAKMQALETAEKKLGIQQVGPSFYTPSTLIRI